MASTKKQAKVGSRRNVVQRDTSQKRSILLSDGHWMTENGSGLTRCGRRGTGWTMGRETDVTCETCGSV